MIKKIIRKMHELMFKKNRAVKPSYRKTIKIRTPKTGDLFKKFDKLNMKHKGVFLLAGFVIFSLFFSKILFWIAVLMFAVAVSKLIQIFFPLVVGFDWGSFACIFIAYYVHPVVALLCVSIASVLGSLLRGQHKADMIALPLFGYISINILFLIFPFQSWAFFNTAALMTLVYAATNILFSYFFMGRIDINSVSFLVTLIINNFFLIKYISPYIVKSAGL
ncbi:MAG: hypothetical protein DRN66_00820 [Candidatus Nanohalarchaeota archaeon]|nr:MAG: hypothetical protein DRN66_00820 [Candidatus Nanohaloarchaeota archaeon]